MLECRCGGRALSVLRVRHATKGNHRLEGLGLNQCSTFEAACEMTVQCARRRPRHATTTTTTVAFNETTDLPASYMQSATLQGATCGYVVSAPLLIAAATVSLVALRKLLPTRHPVARLLRRGLYVQRRAQRALARFVSVSRRRILDDSNSSNNNKNMTASTTFASNDLAARIGIKNPQAQPDGVRDLTNMQQLERNQVAIDNAVDGEGDVTLTDDEFAALPAQQRRKLLANAFAYRSAHLGRRDSYVRTPTVPSASASRYVGLSDAYGADAVPVNSGVSSVGAGTFDKRRAKAFAKSGKRKRKQDKSGAHAAFWHALESVNGRAAALGFMLCLAREIAEPGHPSLFEQVVDVVVPIAQSTPPFLVAVCDRLADLIT